MRGSRVTDVYVIGGSLPALAAALEFAEVGLRVRVALDVPDASWPSNEERPTDAAELADGTEVALTTPPSVVEPGARDHDGALEAFLAHVSAPLTEGADPHPGSAPVITPPRPVQLRTAKGGWAAQPTPAVLGIPAVPMDARSLAVLGGSGAARASLDRIRPVLTIGKVRDLGTLVRSRLGRAALERLVDPIVRDRFGASPDEVEVAVAAPGLNEAVTRAGSLSGAALALADRDVARETRVAPRDGWEHLRDHLLARLALFDAEITRGLPTTARPTDAGWRVTEADGHRIEVRVIVADPGTPVPDAVAAACALVAPEAWRGHAEVEIHDPELPDPTLDALQTVERDPGERWSVRLARGDAGQWRAHLTGPRVMKPGRLRDDGEDHAALVAAVPAVLAAAGVVPTGEIAVAVRPAPHLSLERRDAEASALEALREAEPSLVLVGSALFAGDLADAVSDARTVAVGVRRRLTGIAE